MKEVPALKDDDWILVPRKALIVESERQLWNTCNFCKRGGETTFEHTSECPVGKPGMTEEAVKHMVTALQKVLVSEESRT